MKRTTTIILAIAALFMSSQAAAQTMNIHTGNITTAVTATADEMTYSDGGTKLTVAGKTFNVSEIDSIIVNNTSVSNSTVDVSYNGDEAKVVIAGNIAPYLTANVNGANVTLLQSADLAEEITYTLSGTSTNGSFYMDGELKATVVLNGLTLTSADSAAINIENGKRINVELAEGTVNRLADAADGSQKACFMVNGHTEFKGAGSLTIVGNAKHAFWGDEYVELKKSTGSITVESAAKDGFNVNQYLEIKGGTLTISGTGDDGIQVSKTSDDTDEQNGQVIISGGTINIDITATAAKGIKCEDAMTISGGTINITTSGGGEYDSDDADVSACSALKADGAITITGGTITTNSSGAGGKGISGDLDIDISGGTINVTTTGKQYVYGSLDSSPKGIKADGNLTISGGDITVTATGGEGSEGIESKAVMTISGGNIIVNTYDDALNATSAINISGGQIFANATGNDAIDSNGTLSISGGLVIACGTMSPEGSFDCDQNTFAITGGTIIGLGGDTSTPTTSATTQPVMILRGSGTLSKGSYIALSDANGNNIFAFSLPQAYSSPTIVISNSSLSVGSSYTLTRGATVSGGTPWQGYSTDSTVSGGSTMSTVTMSSIVTNNSGSGGGPGGGGGGPGGGRM